MFFLLISIVLSYLLPFHDIKLYYILDFFLIIFHIDMIFKKLPYPIYYSYSIFVQKNNAYGFSLQALHKKIPLSKGEGKLSIVFIISLIRFFFSFPLPKLR